jgi:hypothetical protein
MGANELRSLMGLKVVKGTQITVKSASAADPKPAKAKPGKPGNQDQLALESVDVLGAPEIDTAAAGGLQDEGDVESLVKGDAAAGRSVSLGVLQSFSKPWVAWGKSSRGASKLKFLYCYNGESLAPCNRELSVISPGAGGSGGIIARSGKDVPAQSFSRQPAAKPSSQQPPPEAPAAVAARTTLSVGSGGIVLCGSGYGHGVGMSQYGARELANRGYSWQEILLHFYTGVTLEELGGDLGQMFIADAAGPEDAGGVVDVALGEGVEAREDEGEATVAGGQGGFYDPFRQP